MEKLRSDVVSRIRACLISTKGRMSVRQLNNDYYTLVGERIPYSKLGFNRLEDFITSEPSLILHRNNAGEFFVDAKINEKSAHITDMIKKQKSSSRKKAPRFSKSVRFDVPANYSQAASVKWRPKDVYNRGKKVTTSPRPAAVSHNQIVRKPSPVNIRVTVPSKVVVPETSTINHARAVQKPEVSKLNVQNRLHFNGIRTVKSVPLNAPINNAVDNKENTAITNVLSKKVVFPNDDEASNPLVNARKRISKKMSELSLERDSGNSSPTSDIVLAPPYEFIRTSDALADLRTFAEMHKLGEVEVSSRLLKTKQNRMFSCKIKVDNQCYSSYPMEFSSALDAERHSAEEALKELIPKYQRRKSLLLSSERDILERIPPMLEKHHHGIWIWQLKLDYADKYNEQLPVDFVKIIDSSPCIQIERCSNDYVLRHCKPGDALQKGQMPNRQITIPNISVPSNTVQFGDDGRLFAMVTYLISTNEVWCQQCNTDESDFYNEMMGRLEIYYRRYELTLMAETINLAGYYVAKYDGDYYRVRAVATNEEEVNCFFIDYGDELLIPRKDLFQLKREFAKAQAQAFVCRLVGLEELAEVSCSSDALQNILYRKVVIEMASDVINDENSNDISLPVYMYDFETQNSINKELIPLLSIESALPELREGEINEVYISNIESNGDVYVQLHSHGFDSLQELLFTVQSQIIENPPNHLLKPITKENSKDKLYFAKYKVDGLWYRIKIIDWSPFDNHAQIYFVDFGNADVIKVDEEVLYPIEALNDVLNQYPFQAVKVRMAMEIIPENFTELARKELPDDQPVLLKTVDTDNEGVPNAEFFRRNHDGSLLCINKSIAMQMEFSKKVDLGLKRMKKDLAHSSLPNNVPSSGALEDPELPEIGTYFEVHVPFAVNPYNFFIQPLQSKAKLNVMMERLQNRYKDVLYSPLHIDQIVPGNIYASKHEDGYWYRTSVIKVIHSGSISVFYCDFGYYANLTVQQLIPLDVEFMELPYQALKAKLAGIKPKHNKWTMEDCEHFKELVEKKQFYPMLVNIEKDILYDSDLVLKIILIDTSSEEDIIIGHELIKRGIAVED